MPLALPRLTVRLQADHASVMSLADECHSLITIQCEGFWERSQQILPLSHENHGVGEMESIAMALSHHHCPVSCSDMFHTQWDSTQRSTVSRDPLLDGYTRESIVYDGAICFSLHREPFSTLKATPRGL